MQKPMQALCSKGEHAQKVCNNQLCKYTSIMCQQQSCQCYARHHACLTSAPFQAFTQRLKSKGMSFFPLKQLLIEWCQKQIKHFNSLIGEIQKSIDDGELILEGDEQKLYNFLNEKKYEQVKSDLVYKEPKIDIKNKINQLQKQIEQASHQIKKALEKVKQQKQKMKRSRNPKQNILNRSNNINYAFSNHLHHGDVQVQGNRIFKKKGDQYRLALLQPAIILEKDLGKSKVRFLILHSVNDHRNIAFGVCQLKEERIKKFQLQLGEDFGKDKSILFAGSGKMRSSLDMKQSRIKSIKVGQIIEVSFDIQTLTVAFINQTTKQKSTITIKQNTIGLVHFCVILQQKDDAVMLVQ